MYIYKITNNLNNKIYIGLSSKKVEESESYYGSGVLIYKAIDKYGKDNFTKTILERDITDFKVLCERERHYIDIYDSINNGYNITEGGGGTFGYKHTNATKEKIRQYLLNQPKDIIEKRAASNRGKTRTEETKLKTSETMKGRKYSKERCNNMKGPRGKYNNNKSTCPHCNMTGRSNNMTRYHFDNCKHKIVNN